jgi:hypothetical protein
MSTNEQKLPDDKQPTTQQEARIAGDLQLAKTVRDSEAGKNMTTGEILNAVITAGLRIA